MKKQYDSVSERKRDTKQREKVEKKLPQLKPKLKDAHKAEKKPMTRERKTRAQISKLEQIYAETEGKLDQQSMKKLMKELNLDRQVIYKFFWDIKTKKNADPKAPT